MQPDPKPPRITAGTVVYAKDLARVSSFYAAVTGLAVTRSERAHVVLASRTFQLVVVAIPDRLSATIDVADPPERREDTAVKAVFVVPSLTDARKVAAGLGGAVDAPEHQWRFQDWLVCDGHDPEGNVIQLRQTIA